MTYSGLEVETRVKRWILRCPVNVRRPCIKWSEAKQKSAHRHGRRKGKKKRGTEENRFVGEDREAFSEWRSGGALLLAAKKGGLKASGKKSHFDAAVHSAAVSRFLDTPKKSSFSNRVGPCALVCVPSSLSSFFSLISFFFFFLTSYYFSFLNRKTFDIFIMDLKYFVH